MKRLLILPLLVVACSKYTPINKMGLVTLGMNVKEFVPIYEKMEGKKSFKDLNPGYVYGVLQGNTLIEAVFYKDTLFAVRVFTPPSADQHWFMFLSNKYGPPNETHKIGERESFVWKQGKYVLYFITAMENLHQTIFVNKEMAQEYDAARGL